MTLNCHQLPRVEGNILEQRSLNLHEVNDFQQRSKILIWGQWLEHSLMTLNWAQLPELRWMPQEWDQWPWHLVKDFDLWLITLKIRQRPLIKFSDFELMSHTLNWCKQHWIEVNDLELEWKTLTRGVNYLDQGINYLEQGINYLDLGPLTLNLGQ